MISTKMKLLTLFFLGAVVDIFFVKPARDLISDLRIFALLFFWVFIIKRYSLDRKATFKVALFFLFLLSFLYVFFREHQSVERIATWIYLLLVLGISMELLKMSTLTKRRVK